MATTAKVFSIGLLLCGMISLSSCDEQSLPGTSECPPGTFGPYKCDGDDCGPQRRDVFNQDGTKFAFVSCDLARW